ncbi:DNA polymerase I [Hypnocyclicus thermotrophus]|uniref:DNA polymerase I n=1 Tax=Hypnocyclicus thermotrophus TaxID=1627895 RepID=A0AA46DZ29_9FUSO|nr:DNA polymerase I [Hypnocyclicus thermotrophus]TDT71450.1 DNA polymerase I [Hypnocyclicus thermotrophus]
MQKAVILDTSAIMYRSYFSLLNMRNKEGEPTGAVYGTANIISSVIDEIKPNYIVATFDVKRKTLKRTEKYENYKANRKPMPDDLVVQLPLIEELMDSFNIKKFKVAGHEADDVMGTISKNLSKQGIEVYIITGDKDIAQLVDENINIVLLGKGEGKNRFKYIKNDDDVIEYLGVKANLIPDLFGMIGDTSDGIPGIRKVGEKKAIPLLNAFGSLEGVYENIDKLTEFKGIGKSLVQNFIEDKELAFLSKELATIKINLDIKIDLNEIKYKDINKKTFKKLCQNLDFKSFIKKYDLDKIDESGNLSLFNNDNKEFNNKKLNNKEKKVVFINNSNEINNLIEKLKKLEEEVIFLFNGVAFLFLIDDNIYYISYKHNYIGAQNIEKSEIQKIFNLNKKFVTYKFKDILNERFNIKIGFDIMLAHYLLYANLKDDLDTLIFNEIGEAFESQKDIFGKTAISQLEKEKLADFLSKRILALKEIYKIVLNKLKKENLEKLLIEIEQPLVPVLSNMELEGITLDRGYLSKYSIELKEKIEQLKKEIYKIAGEEFNINSPKQLAEILFIKLNINPIKKTKTGYSTNVDVLEKLVRSGEKIAKYILEYRKLTKLLNTYVEALPKLVDNNSKLHTSFNQNGTATGRLSSTDPNLQNIPSKTEEGRKIRRAFIAKDGFSLVSFDYSQIELRVLAEISKDTELINAYENDLDLHAITAMKIFDLETLEEVDSIKRNIAKIVNFSIIYGKTPFGLAQELNITVKDAKEYIDKYFDKYKKVKDLQNEIIKFAKENGYVKTLFDRKRKIIGIDNKNKNIKNQAERMAVNTVIQGSAADILKMVMIELFDKIVDNKDVYMLLQVHDELIFEIKDEKLEEMIPKIKEIMENKIRLQNVKLKVNFAYAKNWSEAK